MKNLNPYNGSAFSEHFKKTKVYQCLSQDFDEICFQYFIESIIEFDGTYMQYRTPRQDRATSLTSAAPFYYLEFLTNKNPQTIYDLGCGWNMFKRYIPNIIGVDVKPRDSDKFFADINDYVDDNYIKSHQGYFESVFSINALHFRPLSDLGKIATDFMSMIKPGGMGYLALNLMRMLERDKEKFKDYSDTDLDRYVRQELDNISIPIKYHVFDVDLSVKNAYFDGNIRFVAQRSPENF